MVKPKGGMAFITDFERKDIKDMKAITGGKMEEEAAPVKSFILPPPPAKKPEQMNVENSDLPRFEDD